MPTRTARTADEIADNLRSLVDRMVDARFTQEIARRGQEVADVLAERSAEVGSMANEAWRDTRPVRRHAAKRVSRTTNDWAKWSDRAWRKSLRPMLKDAWKRRTVALGAAGAAVPAGRELVEEAATRLGIKQREERHWGAFFLGLVLGAVAGAVVAMLTTPKRGSEMRRELGARADEIATRARDEWVPMFQREDSTNGHPVEPLPGQLGGDTASLQEGAAEAGAATGEAADQAAADTAEAINESYESVDRESTT